jgi:hypothetical protein
MLSHPAFGPRTALAYVTGGTLMCVWTLVWYYTREDELTRSQWFWISGIFLSGVTFVFLGLVLGPLGRAARQAELPPTGAAHAEAAIQQTAAAHPPAMAAPIPGAAAPMAPGPVGTPMANPAVPAAPMPPAQVAPAQ